jgi:F-type H+-transporting ATPase subunit b
MELFKIEPGLAIWTWITFSILLLILWKFLFPNLMKSIKDREKMISKSVDNAVEIEKRLDNINSEYNDTIRKARSEADKLLLNTRKEADVLKQKLLKKAEAEAEEIVLQAKEKTIDERKIMLQSFQGDIADFVCSISEKVVDTSFTGENDRQLVMELLKKL